MSDGRAAATVLRRAPLSRVFGTDLFQWLAWVLVIVAALFLWASDAERGGPGVPALFWLWLAAPLFILWSATGGARVDADGLSWRLRLPVRARWADVTKLELAAPVAGRYYTGAASRSRPPTRLIRVYGPVSPGWLPLRRHVVASAVRPGLDNEGEFVRALVAAARAAGVPVEVTHPVWEPLVG